MKIFRMANLILVAFFFGFILMLTLDLLKQFITNRFKNDTIQEYQQLILGKAKVDAESER